MTQETEKKRHRIAETFECRRINDTENGKHCLNWPMKRIGVLVECYHRRWNLLLFESYFAETQANAITVASTLLKE